MDFDELYHFFFQTMPGIGLLMLIFIVLFILVALILERRTRKHFENRKNEENDSWSLFGDDEDEGDEEAADEEAADADEKK